MMKTRYLTSIALAALLAGTISTANATVLYESSMTAGVTPPSPALTSGNLVGQDGWAAHSGTGSLIQVGATGTTLVQGSGSREDANQAVTAIVAGQTYYYGFDVEVSGGDTDVYFAHFLNGATTFTTRAWVTADAGGDFTFALSSGNSIGATWATPLTFGETYRVVGAYDFDSGTNRLWVDPVLETDTNLSVAGAASVAFDAFAFRQSSGDSQQLITNLAVGTTFADVVPVPEPTSFALGGVGLVALAGIARARRKQT